MKKVTCLLHSSSQNNISAFHKKNHVDYFSTKSTVVVCFFLAAVAAAARCHRRLCIVVCLPKRLNMKKNQQQQRRMMTHTDTVRAARTQLHSILIGRYTAMERMSERTSINLCVRIRKMTDDTTVARERRFRISWNLRTDRIFSCSHHITHHPPSEPIS